MFCLSFLYSLLLYYFYIHYYHSSNSHTLALQLFVFILTFFVICFAQYSGGGADKTAKTDNEAENHKCACMLMEMWLMEMSINSCMLFSVCLMSGRVTYDSKKTKNKDALLLGYHASITLITFTNGYVCCCMQVLFMFIEGLRTIE